MTYDGVESIPMATLVRDTVCCTMSGLSKIYRACGYRVGWAAFSGNLRGAGDYLSALELLTSLRLCSNVPAQWAVQTALGGYQSIKELLAPGGRLYESRRAILEATSASRFLHARAAEGIDVRVRAREDRGDCRTSTIRFSRSTCSNRNTCCSRPGTSFNVPYRDHFRTTLLPDAALLKKVFVRIDELLVVVCQPAAGDEQRVVHAESRFK